MDLTARRIAVEWVVNHARPRGWLLVCLWIRSRALPDEGAPRLALRDGCMARLAAHLLGSFQVTLDGQPIGGFESDKARALLAYLVVENDRPHRREKLAGLLWPELPERAARANLRRVLANLRQITGDHEARPSRFSVTPQTIHLEVASDLWSDVAVLSALQSLPSDTDVSESIVVRIEEGVLPLLLLLGSWTTTGFGQSFRQDMLSSTPEQTPSPQ